MTVPIDIRLATREDHPFFYSATLKSYYYGASHCRIIPQKLYYDEHGALLERLVKRPAAQLLLATLKEDPDVILGFVLFEPDIMHYTYVKQLFRRMGIAKQLWTKADLDTHYQFSHRTYDMVKVTMNKHGAIYNPYLQMESA